MLGSLLVFAKVFEVFWACYNSNDASVRSFSLTPEDFFINKSEKLKKQKKILAAIY